MGKMVSRDRCMLGISHWPILLCLEVFRCTLVVQQASFGELLSVSDYI